METFGSGVITPSIILVNILLLCSHVSGRKPITKQLYDDLFDNYKTQVLPVCHEGGFVNVSINVALRQIVNLDEKDQILTTNVWIRMGWYDCQLVWDPKDYNKTTYIWISYDSIWVPDLALYDSSAEEEMMPGRSDYRASVTSEGQVHYNFPTVFKSICRVNVVYFPFDDQVCGLKLGSWSHSVADLDIYPANNSGRHGDLSNFIENNEWIVVSLLPIRTTKPYASGTYTDVEYQIKMRRRADFYVMTLLFPCILVSAIAAIGFLLPPESGEKVSLEVTVLLSQAVFLLVISDLLPPSADNFPIVGTYFAISMLLVSLSLVLAVFVLNVHHRGDVPGKKVPVWARKVFLQCLGSLCNRKKRKHTIYNAGRTESPVPRIPNGDVHRYETRAFDDIRPPTRETNLDANTASETNEVREESPTWLQLAVEQLGVLRDIERHFESEDDTEVEREDWQRLARVLDRVFLILYLTCFTIVTVIYVIQLSTHDRGGEKVT